MTPTNKGNYLFCVNCIYKIKDSLLKYPCIKSHKKVRSSDNVKYEREFKMCRLKETLIKD